MSADMRHNDIVDAISKVAARVMMVALPVDATITLDFDQAAQTLRQDVIQVLQLQKFPPVYILEHGHWSPLIKAADERTKLIFVALVLGIYE